MELAADRSDVRWVQGNDARQWVVSGRQIGVRRARNPGEDEHRPPVRAFVRTFASNASEALIGTSRRKLEQVFAECRLGASA